MYNAAQTESHSSREDVTLESHLNDNAVAVHSVPGLMLLFCEILVCLAAGAPTRQSARLEAALKPVMP